MNLQKAGGWSAIVLACVIHIQLFTANIISQGMPRSSDFHDPAMAIAAYQNSPVACMAYPLLGIVIAFLTLFVALALQERMQSNAPHIMRFVVITASTYFTLYVLCQMSDVFRNALLADSGDISAHKALIVLHESLGYTAVHAWGWGLLFLAWAALKTHALPRMLGCVILAYGIVGIIQFAFAISPLLVVGWGLWMLLGSIVFVWLGVILIRKPASVSVRT
jgi:hypothetical protein